MNDNIMGITFQAWKIKKLQLKYYYNYCNDKKVVKT